MNPINEQLLSLRHQAAALTQEIDAIRLEMNMAQAKLQSVRSVLLSREEKRAQKLSIENAKARLRPLESMRREILKSTKELSPERRKQESAYVYEAMRLSRLGVRGCSYKGEPTNQELDQ